MLPWPSLYEDIWHCEFLQIMWKLIFPTLSQLESLQLNSNWGTRSLHRLRTRGEYQRLPVGLSSHKVDIPKELLLAFGPSLTTLSFISNSSRKYHKSKIPTHYRLEEGCHSTTVELSGLGSVVGEVIVVFFIRGCNNNKTTETKNNYSKFCAELAHILLGLVVRRSILYFIRGCNNNKTTETKNINSKCWWNSLIYCWLP